MPSMWLIIVIAIAITGLCWMLYELRNAAEIDETLFELDDDDDLMVVLANENGEEHTFCITDIVSVITSDGTRDYALLVSAEDGIVDADSDDVLVLRLLEDGDTLEPIEDPAEFEAVVRYIEDNSL